MPATLPVIDLEPWFAGNPQQRLELCQRVRQVCHEVGFFYLINHGIPASISDSYLQTLKAFFALSKATKQAIDKHGSAQFRGWEQLGSELTNNQVDYREQIDIGVERSAISDPDPYYMALVGPNQWPPQGAQGPAGERLRPRAVEIVLTLEGEGEIRRFIEVAS